MKKFLIGTVLCASSLIAQSNPSNTYSYELTPFVSGILTDSKSGLSDDNYLNGGISLAKNLDDSFIDQVEVLYMRSANLEYENSDSTNINRAFLNAVKKFELTEKLAAYGLAGLGYQDITHELNENNDSPVLNYGVGLKYDIPYYGIALKGDVRHLITTKNSQNDVMYTLGLGMPLGKKDNNDIKVVAPKVQEEKKELVIEKTTPMPKKEVSNDDDNDGVINKLDKCPNTSPGVQVNKDGCVDTINLNINFDNNSAVIKNEYNAKIEEFINVMKSDETLKATIEAHTDSKGTDAYNQNLSDRRAISVVNSLKAAGIESSRLKAIGYGESQPIATNETEQGKAQNRRVTALLNR